MKPLQNHTNNSTIPNFPSASRIDNIIVNLLHVLPYYLRGIFTRNRYLVQLIMALRLYPFSNRFCSHLQQKYHSDSLYINMFGRKTLLILNIEDMRYILDNSPHIYAEAHLKYKGMSHFQPNAVTISHGEAWKNRRYFNEHVLASGQSLHPSAKEFLIRVQGEMSGKTISTWDNFSLLFERISLGVFTGDSTQNHLTRLLKTLMKRSNRIFWVKKPKEYDDFYRAVRKQVQTPQKNTLLSYCPHAPTTTMTEVESQVTHWLFAMNETLASSVFKTLALIVTHPQAEESVRAEMSQVNLKTVQGIDDMCYLEACLQEAMRLWPSTQLLVRKSLQRDSLRAVIIPAYTQIIIPNTFHHRNTQVDPKANYFQPEIWKGNDINYHYNHLSNGSQICAGKALAFFIAKAVLVSILENKHYVLSKPALTPEKPLPNELNKYRLKFKLIKNQ